MSDAEVEVLLASGEFGCMADGGSLTGTGLKIRGPNSSDAARLGPVAAGAVGGLSPLSCDGSLPLSFAQQRLWFVDRLREGASVDYSVPVVFRLRGTLDVAALQRAFDRLPVARHESLRTVFPDLGGKPVQRVCPAMPVPVRVEACDPDALDLAVEREVSTPFSLARGPLLRVLVLRLSDTEHVLVLTLHHIVTDGWSMGLLLGELAQLYAGFRSGLPVTLLLLRLQYADYAVWQREAWAGDEPPGPGYRLKQLDGLVPVESLTDHRRDVAKAGAGGVVRFDIEARVVEGLRKIVSDQNVSLFMVLLSAFQALLGRYAVAGGRCRRHRRVGARPVRVPRRGRVLREHAGDPR